jgi:electron transfer flavoprotein alpha subunit
MTKKIAIIVEQGDGKVKPILYELLSMAQKIQAIEECRITLFIIGDKIDKLSQNISMETGHDIFVVNTPGFIKYNGSIYTKILKKLFTRMNFDYICAPHSTSGMDYAPALSISVQAPCITSVEDVIFEEKKICFVRSMFGGKLSAKFFNHACPVVMTVQPGSFKPFLSKKKPSHAGSGKLTRVVYEYHENTMAFTGTRVSPAKGSVLNKADVIVSGGRGIGEQENYKYIEMLANLFPRSATGASRPVCDYGWVKYHKQVGMTGTLVSPKLYIACGISGASQHVGGIRDSKFIVAINSDPEAPVFRIADVCIVEDTIEFICLFVEKYKKDREFLT